MSNFGRFLISAPSRVYIMQEGFFASHQPVANLSPTCHQPVTNLSPTCRQPVASNLAGLQEFSEIVNVMNPESFYLTFGVHFQVI